jgi:hypothetical protein
LDEHRHTDGRPQAERVRQAVFIVVVAALTVALVVLVGGIHLLEPGGPAPEAIQDFTKKVDAVKTPAEFALGSISALGMLAGGGLVAIGMQQGMRMMALSAAAGLGVLLGNGLIK